MSYKLPSNMFAVKAWTCMAVSVGSVSGSSTSDRSMAIGIAAASGILVAIGIAAASGILVGCSGQ